MSHSNTQKKFWKILKTERLTVTAKAQNTLQHFQGASAPLAHACGRPCPDAVKWLTAAMAKWREMMDTLAIVPVWCCGSSVPGASETCWYSQTCQCRCCCRLRSDCHVPQWTVASHQLPFITTDTSSLSSSSASSTSSTEAQLHLTIMRCRCTRHCYCGCLRQPFTALSLVLKDRLKTSKFLQWPWFCDIRHQWS